MTEDYEDDWNEIPGPAAEEMKKMVEDIKEAEQTEFLSTCGWCEEQKHTAACKGCGICLCVECLGVHDCEMLKKERRDAEIDNAEFMGCGGCTWEHYEGPHPTGEQCKTCERNTTVPREQRTSDNHEYTFLD